jgi:hypothetical protein
MCKIYSNWVDVLFFLPSFIWSLVSGLIRFRAATDEGTASNCVQISEEA